MSTVEERKARRTLGANGRWYAAHLRPDQHGTFVAWTYWLCECTPCITNRAAAQAESARRRKHNRRILAEIQHSHALVGAPARQSDNAPEPAALLVDEAGKDGSPLPAPATQNAEEVQPTQPQPAPGPPTDYITQVREKLLAAGLGQRLGH